MSQLARNIVNPSDVEGETRAVKRRESLDREEPRKKAKMGPKEGPGLLMKEVKKEAKKEMKRRVKKVLKKRMKKEMEKVKEVAKKEAKKEAKKVTRKVKKLTKRLAKLEKSIQHTSNTLGQEKQTKHDTAASHTILPIIVAAIYKDIYSVGAGLAGILCDPSPENLELYLQKHKQLRMADDEDMQIFSNTFSTVTRSHTKDKNEKR